MEDTYFLAQVRIGERSPIDFYDFFDGKYSEGFDPTKDFSRVGVVNQTTMLATETQAIADKVKECMEQVYGSDQIKQHFADTRDTLCYATNDNQDSTYALLEKEAHLAVVVGGYNSSNTSHIVELCERKFPTYFINGPDQIESFDTIHHFDYPNHKHLTSNNWIPDAIPLKVILTSGASCPDTLVDQVMLKMISYFSNTKSVEEDIADLMQEN